MYTGPYNFRTELVALALEALSISLHPLMQSMDILVMYVHSETRDALESRREVARSLGMQFSDDGELLDVEVDDGGFSSGTAQTRALAYGAPLLRREIRALEAQMASVNARYCVTRLLTMSTKVGDRALSLYSWLCGCLLAAGSVTAPALPSPPSSSLSSSSSSPSSSLHAAVLPLPSTSASSNTIPTTSSSSSSSSSTTSLVPLSPASLVPLSPAALVAGVPDYVIDNMVTWLAALPGYKNTLALQAVTDGRMTSIIEFLIVFSGVFASPSYSNYVVSHKNPQDLSQSVTQQQQFAIPAAAQPPFCYALRKAVLNKIPEILLGTMLPSSNRGGAAGGGEEEVDADGNAVADSYYVDRASHPLCQSRILRAHTVAALLHIYAEVETGRGQYYERLSVRFGVTRVLKALLTIEEHNAAFHTIAATGSTALSYSSLVRLQEMKQKRKSGETTVPQGKDAPSSSSSSSPSSLMPSVSMTESESDEITFPLFDRFLNILFSDVHEILDSWLDTIKEIKRREDDEEEKKQQRGSSSSLSVSPSLSRSPNPSASSHARSDSDRARSDSASADHDHRSNNNNNNNDDDDDDDADGQSSSQQQQQRNRDIPSVVRMPLEQLEEQAVRTSRLALSALRFLVDVSKLAPRTFLQRDFIHRVATIVSVYVSQLVNDKASELMVKDIKRYNFRPIQMLSQIVSVFLELASVPSLSDVTKDVTDDSSATATQSTSLSTSTSTYASSSLDAAPTASSSLPASSSTPSTSTATTSSSAVSLKGARAAAALLEETDTSHRGGAAFLEAFADVPFSEANFTAARTLLASKHRLSAEQNAVFAAHIDAIQTIVTRHKERENILSNSPSEFNDGIMFTLMQYPVRLPDGTVVDYLPLKRLLMKECINPFTRQKLGIQDLVPDLDLKKRIDEWVAEQLGPTNSKQ